MPRASQIVLIVALVVGAFFLGRWSRTPATSPAEQAVSGNAAMGTSASPTGSAPSMAGIVSGRDGSEAAPQAASGVGMPPRGAGASQPLPDVPVSARWPGPQPLLDSDLPLLDKAERAMGADGGAARDLLDLAKDEAPDDDARRIEALIAQTIREKGGRYTALRLSPSRCTRSVCIVRGIGAGQMQDVRSDWQRLSGTLMSQPWFREVFDDSRGVVTSDGPDTVYITLFVRCAPGTCRLGRR